MTLKVGLCGDELLRASTAHIRDFNVGDLTETVNCKPCAMRKDTKKPRQTLEFEDREAENRLSVSFPRGRSHAQ